MPGKFKADRELRLVARDGFVLAVTDDTAKKMAKVGSHDTRPEMLVRRCLSALGHRYRLQAKDLPGRPDIVNRCRKWAIFVHGCYWHQHPGCARATLPRRNREFWIAKFRRNRERDAASVVALRQLGFKVVVVWECETKDPAALKRLFRKALPQPKRQWQ